MEQQQNRTVLVDNPIELVVNMAKIDVGRIAEVNFVLEDTKKLAEWYVEEVYRKQTRSELQKFLKYEVIIVAAACVDIACREKSEPRTKKEICERSRLKMTEYTNVLADVSAILKVPLKPIIKPNQLIPRFCELLGKFLFSAFCFKFSE